MTSNTNIPVKWMAIESLCNGSLIRSRMYGALVLFCGKCSLMAKVLIRKVVKTFSRQTKVKRRQRMIGQRGLTDFWMEPGSQDLNCARQYSTLKYCCPVGMKNLNCDPILRNL